MIIVKTRIAQQHSISGCKSEHGWELKGIIGFELKLECKGTDRFHKLW